jgi:hypothetical protein
VGGRDPRISPGVVMATPDGLGGGALGSGCTTSEGFAGPSRGSPRVRCQPQGLLWVVGHRHDFLFLSLGDSFFFFSFFFRVLLENLVYSHRNSYFFQREINSYSCA